MKSVGLVFNYKRMLIYFILLIFGLSLILFGVISFYQDQISFKQSISDDEIIRRAKDLGMIEIKENITTTEDTND